MTHPELINSIRDLLGAKADADLQFLANIDPGDLAKLHEAIAKSVRRTQELQEPIYVVMAQATKLIPKFVLVRMSKPLSAYVLAQSTMHLDAKSSAALGKAMGFERMADIQDEMIRMGAYEKIAAISDETDIDLLGPLAQRNGNPMYLAKIAAHMRDMKRLKAIANALPTDLREKIGAQLLADGHGGLVAQFR